MSKLFQKAAVSNLLGIKISRTTELTVRNFKTRLSFLFLILLLLSSLYSYSQDLSTTTKAEIRVKQIENINNPALWNMKRMKADIAPINDHYPIRNGAFPVPYYNSLGYNYGGGGSISNHFSRSLSKYRIKLDGKELGFTSFHIGNSPLYSKNQRDKTFFTLITVIDTVNTKNFAIGGTAFLSRNHPDYGGEGSFMTKNNKVDFVAFTTPDKGSFAIVNMRLFHLEHGNIILVNPQKDGSFRSLQINGDVPTNEEVYNYLRNDILKRKNVVTFFAKDGLNQK